MVKRERDPNEPKRPLTAFMYFMNDYRGIFKKENPDSKGVTEVTKSGGEKWKGMGAEDKAPYEAQAKTAREEYDTAKAAYAAKVESGELAKWEPEEGGGKKQKKKRDPNMPKKPLTAYMFYMMDFRPKYKEEFPDSKGIKDAAKAGGEKWKSLDAEARATYEAKAATAREEYLKAKAAATVSKGADAPAAAEVEEEVDEDEDEDEDE